MLHHFPPKGEQPHSNLSWCLTTPSSFTPLASHQSVSADLFLGIPPPVWVTHRPQCLGNLGLSQQCCDSLKGCNPFRVSLLLVLVPSTPQQQWGWSFLYQVCLNIFTMFFPDEIKLWHVMSFAAECGFSSASLCLSTSCPRAIIMASHCAAPIAAAIIYIAVNSIAVCWKAMRSCRAHCDVVYGHRSSADISASL